MNFQIVIDSLYQIIVDILEFVPSLINGFIILLAGYLIAMFLRWLLRSLLQKIGFDALIERAGITGSLRGLGMTTPISAILAQTIFIFLLLSFMITATRLM
ncbi:MAG: hypothetical protein HGA19_17390, partial [Oscillochloris sp.]|nr:hypothetical protein [Oscillochloris sp.]